MDYMNYNFIKDIYIPVVNDAKTDIAVLKPFISDRENSYILNHNISAIAKMLRFLESSNNIFILNGFMGSGKTYVADCFLDFINEDVLIFKNSYQEAINLDDILLSMFKDFSIYHNEKKIILPKIDTNIFSEKINAYIKYCNSPMLFIFDSFEINMRSRDSQKDILDFINYLSHFEKIKIVICSRSFKKDDLISSDSAADTTLEALSKDEMYEYLEQNKIHGGKYETEELYRVTRGHYLLLELSVLIMQILDISLTLFSTEYKKSSKNFLEFLISKLLSISSEKFVKLLLFLSVMRHGINAEFLLNQNLASDEDLSFLLQKHVLSEKFGNYYLKDYVKSEFIKSINTETRLKVHKYVIELYESELPLKPFDRELFLSRQTMRQEIAFHNKIVEKLNEELLKSGKSKLTEGKDYNYISYSKSSGFEAGMDNRKTAKRYINKIKSSVNEKKKRFELSKEDSALLHSSVSSKEDNITKELHSISAFEEKQTEYKEEKHLPSDAADNVPDSLEDYLEIAQNYEDAYNYSSAILYYKKALTYTNDEDFSVKEPIIYTKLAICYKKIQNADEAVRLYEKVYEIYLKNHSEKANSILLSIAQIYSEIYKFDKAKETYNRILYSPITAPSGMIVRVYLDLSELEDNNLDIEAAIKYIQQALSEAEKTSDVRLISECYFKYALLLDDINNRNLALKYYLRCIQSSNDAEVNQYLSSAYFNLAEISSENNNKSAAKMYYELAVEADKKQNNYEGLYYSYSKLAELYKGENSEKTYEYLIKALSAAKRFDDIRYALAVYVELGDYYLREEEYKRALKSYILARTLAPAHSAEDIISKINARINKVKLLLGDIEFSRLMSEIKKKR